MTIEPSRTWQSTRGGAERPAPAGGGDLPEGEAVSQLVAAVWHEVLGGDPPHDAADFFEIGGGSLSAMRVCARISTRLGPRVPVRLIFEARRLDAFSARVTELVQHARSESLDRRP